MKKINSILLMMVAILILSACGGEGITQDLQKHKWNVVSTNGEAYTGEFSESTVTFKMGVFTVGFNYKVEDDEIHLEEDGNDPVIFEVEKKGDEYRFIAISEDVKDQYGDLTLSPSK